MTTLKQKRARKVKSVDAALQKVAVAYNNVQQQYGIVAFERACEKLYLESGKLAALAEELLEIDKELGST